MQRSLGAVAIVAAAVWLVWFLATSDAPRDLDASRGDPSAGESEVAPTLTGSQATLPRGGEPDDGAAVVAREGYPEGYAEVRILVATDSGKVVRGAHVSLYLQRESFIEPYDAGASILALKGDDEHVGRVIATGQTDTDGRIVFRQLDPRAKLRVQVGARPPLGVAGQEVVATVAPSGWIHLLAVEGYPFRARLVDQEGVGRGGMVSLTLVEAEDVAHAGWRRGPIRSDVDGFVSVDSVPGGVYRASLRVPGYGAREDVRFEHPSAGVLKLRLDEDTGTRVYGRVMGPTGVPQAGAKVAIVSRAGEGTSSRRCTRIAVADREGRYEILGMPVGELVDTDCLAAGHVAAPHETPIRRLVAGEDAQINFVLRAGTYLRGSVLTPEGSPVPGAYVSVTKLGVSRSGAASRGHLTRTRVASDGSFTLGPLPYGAGIVVAKAPGFVLGERGARIFEGNVIGHGFVLDEGGSEALAIEMVRGDPLGGRVVDAAGQGVAGLRVQLIGPSRMWSRVHAVPIVMTGKDGAFTFPGLLPFKRFGVRVFDGERTKDFDIRRGADNALFFERGASISGSIAWSGELPSSGVRLMVQCSDGDRRTLMAQGAGLSFRVGGLPPGYTRVYVVSALGEPIGETVGVELKPGAHQGGIRIRVSELLTQIRGHVRHADGTPAARVSLTISPSDAVSFDPRGMVLSGADGTFVVSGLPEGSYKIHAEDATESVTAKSGATDVVVTLAPRMPRLRGTVVDPNGNPVARARIQIIEAELPSGLQMTRVHEVVAGVFDVAMRPGTTTVEILALGAADANEVEMNVESQSLRVSIQEPVRIQFQPGRAIHGRVVDERGDGIGRVVISAAPDRERRGAWSDMLRPKGFRVTTDATGSFVLAAASRTVPLKVHVQYAPPEFVIPEEASISLTQDTFKLVLKRGAVTLRGRVVDGEERGLSYAHITARFGGASSFDSVGTERCVRAEGASSWRARGCVRGAPATLQEARHRRHGRRRSGGGGADAEAPD